MRIPVDPSVVRRRAAIEKEIHDLERWGTTGNRIEGNFDICTEGIAIIMLKTTSDQSDSICVVDVETTGLNPEDGCVVVEVALVIRLDDGEIEEFSCLLKYSEDYKDRIDAATKWNGINFEMTNDKGVDRELAAKNLSNIFSLIKEKNIPVMSYVAGFDKKFIESFMMGEGYEVDIEIGCLMIEALKTINKEGAIGIKRMKLSTAMRYFGLDDSANNHRALSDCYAALQLHDFVKNKNKKKMGA